MPRKNGSDEVSLGELAQRGLDRIVKLSQSQLISEKLQSLNILFVVFILTVVTTHFLIGSTTSGLTLAIFLVVSFLFALIISLGYGPVLSIVSNVSSNKVESLRVGITMLFISLTLGVAALTFNNELLAKLSLGLIGLQLIIMPISSLLVPKIFVEDKKVDLSQLWTALGRLSSIVGLISFAVDVILLLMKYGV